MSRMVCAAALSLAACASSDPEPDAGAPPIALNARAEAEQLHEFTVEHLLSTHGSYYYSIDNHAETAEWFNASQIYADTAMLAFDDRYLPYVTNTFASFMPRLWDTGAPEGGYFALAKPDGSDVVKPDKYTDDNALTGIVYLEAARHVPAHMQEDFVVAARAIANYLMFSPAWDAADGGFYWNTGPQNHYRPAQSNALAVQLFLELYERDGVQVYRDWADTIMAWLDARLYDPADGLYGWHDGDTETKFAYDNAILIEVHLRYYAITQSAAHLAAAQALAARLHDKLWDAEHGGYVMHSNDALGGHRLSPVFAGWVTQALLRLYDVDHDSRWLARARDNAQVLLSRLRHFQNVGVMASCAPDGTAPDITQQTVDQAWMQRVLALLAGYADE